jgi:hypothetical protein
MVTTQVDHEVRIRLLEAIAEKIEKRFDKLDSKIDSHFYWVLGTIITLIIALVTMFGGIVLHLAKLI